MEAYKAYNNRYSNGDSKYGIYQNTSKDCEGPVVEVKSNVKCLDNIVKKELGFGPDSDQEACCI